MSGGRAYQKRIQAKRDREKAERRRAQRMRTLRIWGSVLGAIALAVVLFFVFKPSAKKETPNANPTSSTSPTGSPVTGCTGPTPNAPAGKQYPSPPPMTIDQKDTIYVATLATSCGNVKIKMDPKTAPASVNNFVFLAKEGWYDGSKFHRIQNEPDFAIVQGGDAQKGDGTGGPGYSYNGETPPAGTKYKRGTVAMANSGKPSSNGSQFFIVVKDWDSLPANYTVFGEIIDEGDSFATLDRMIKAQGSELGNGLGISPNPPIFIIKVTIEELARG